MKNFLLIASAGLLLTGCMSLGEFGTIKDFPAPHDPHGVISVASKTYDEKFGGMVISTYQLYYNCALDGEEDMIVLQKIATPGSKTAYRIHHEFYGDDWRHMKTLTFFLDGEPVLLTSKNPIYSEPSGKVDENLFYEVNEGFLGRLAQAKMVKLLFFRSPVSLAAETQAQLADAVALLEGL